VVCEPMFNPIIVSTLITLLAMLGVIGQYKEILILKSSYYLYIGIALAIIYLIVRRTHSIKKWADRLVVLSSTLFVVQMSTSYVYNHWKMTSLISAYSIMKILLVLLTLTAVYINFAYVRAEQTYKKKRGNQRIKSEPKKPLMELLRELRRREKEEEEKNSVTFTLGYSAENEDV